MRLWWRASTGMFRSTRSGAELDALIEEATVDAHGDAEQRTDLFTMIEEHLAVPFETEMLGVPVTVERVDLTEAEEIVAICRRGRFALKDAVPDDQLDGAVEADETYIGGKRRTWPTRAIPACAK